MFILFLHPKAEIIEPSIRISIVYLNWTEKRNVKMDDKTKSSHLNIDFDSKACSKQRISFPCAHFLKWLLEISTFDWLPVKRRARANNMNAINLINNGVEKSHWYSEHASAFEPATGY